MAGVRPMTKPMFQMPAQDEPGGVRRLAERQIPKVPLPAGQPREWYETHNRQLKAMRLAIALLDSGVYTPNRATDRRICGMADRIGIRPPSRVTCRLVRSLIPAAAPAHR